MQHLQKINIKPYLPENEAGWIRCKALAYLHSQFNDQMSQTKDQYSKEQDGYKEVIELVALIDHKVVGLLDAGIYCEERNLHDPYVQTAHQDSYLDTIAVHPDYQRLGIAQKLWNELQHILKEKNIDYLTIFTRDDLGSNLFYKKNGAELLTKHFRIKGALKKEPYSRGKFNVDLKNQTIGEISSDGRSLPFSPDYPHTFWVYNENDLDLFDVDTLQIEHTYVVYLK